MKSKPATESIETETPEGEEGDNDVGKIIDTKLNGAISNHLTRFKQSFTKEVGDIIAGHLKPFQEQMAKPAEDKKDKSEKSAKSEEVLALTSKVKEMEDSLQKERTAREQERQTRLQSEERAALTEALTKAGVDSARIRGAIALLYTEEKRVGRTESGEISWKIPKAGFVEDADLATGVGDWLKTDEGKAYLPPRDAMGSGGRQAQASRNGATNDKAAARAEAAGVLQQLFQQGGYDGDS